MVKEAHGLLPLRTANRVHIWISMVRPLAAEMEQLVKRVYFYMDQKHGSEYMDPTEFESTYMWLLATSATMLEAETHTLDDNDAMLALFDAREDLKTMRDEVSEVMAQFKSWEAGDEPERDGLREW